MQWTILVGVLLAAVLVAGHKRFSSTWAAAVAFGIPVTVALGAFASALLAHKMPLVYTPDSYNYLCPGLRILTGDSVAACGSPRSIGYPALIAAALNLVTLRDLPTVQLLAFGLVTLASLSIVLLLFLGAVTGSWSKWHWRGARLSRLAVMAIAGVTFIALIANQDGFVLYLYNLMPEAPHLAIASLGLMLFTASWLANPGRSRLLLALGAFVVTYLSILVKPMTLLTLGLTGTSLVAIAWVERRELRRLTNLAMLTLAVFAIGAADRVNTRATSPQAGLFGSKTLFCFHIPIVLSAVGEATPERSQLSSVLRGVLARGPDGYPALGFNGDKCQYNMEVDHALQRAVDSENADLSSWLMDRFLIGVAGNPLAYAQVTGHQLGRYFLHPIGEITYQHTASISEVDWVQLQPYVRYIGMDQSEFAVEVINWIPRDFTSFAGPAKRLLNSVHRFFAITLAVATTLALIHLVRRRRSREGCKPEAVLICVGSFVLTWLVLIAAAHSFDVGRYSAELAPLAVLWCMVAISYIAYWLASGYAKKKLYFYDVLRSRLPRVRCRRSRQDF